MIRRILVPLDGSALAEEVLPHVEDLARRLPAEVHFVQVVGLTTSLLTLEPGAGAMVDPNVVTRQLEEELGEAERYLGALAHEWRNKGLGVNWDVLRGTAAAGITEFAREHNFDLIAMSTHGRSGLGRLVFGSVADQVLREAGSPVLLIKPAKQPSRPRE